MMDARIEVAVIADGHRKEELGLPYRHEILLQAFALPALERQGARQLAPQLARGAAAHRREAVQRRAGANAERREVEDLVADRDAATRRLLLSFALEDAEGQVLDRKIAAGLVRRLDPAPERRVVRRIEPHRCRRLKPDQTAS